MMYGEGTREEIIWYWIPNYQIPWTEDFEAILDQQWAERIGLA